MAGPTHLTLSSGNPSSQSSGASVVVPSGVTQPSLALGMQAETALAPTGATPLMAQYLDIKVAYPGYLLFYRMGDFYELFFDDAGMAARALDIALTARGKHDGKDIPMCGVPVHAADSYLERLIRQGFKVAVCEQTEDPAEAKKRGSKSVVRREVVRLVTPGTLTEETLLDARTHNYLAALAGAQGGAELALAWLDISTGDFCVKTTAPADLFGDIAALAPGELLLSETMLTDEALKRGLDETSLALTFLPRPRFDSVGAEMRLKTVFGVKALEGFGNFTRADMSALGALLDYVELTQVGRLPFVKPPRRQESSAVMMIDAATRANLEIIAPLNVQHASMRGPRCLREAVDLTLTAQGARELKARLASPLNDTVAIAERLDQVEWLVSNSVLREDMRACLRRCPDLSRALSRLSLGRGGPRDLGALRDGLETAQKLARLINEDDKSPVPFLENLAGLSGHAMLVDRLRAALNENLPLFARDGGFITPGYDGILDEHRRLRDESRRVIAELQSRYQKDSGLRALKIKHNNVLGYFVEVTPSQASKLQEAPLRDIFIHRQSIASAVRFTTTELADLEMKLMRAGEEALARELALFDELHAEILKRQKQISRAADELSMLDVACGLAELAARRNWVRPKVDDSLTFRIDAGRHPVVEAALEITGGAPFVPNNCDLSPTDDRESWGGRLWLLTGPNMAGKSTFLRQNALIAVLAQMGSFVPARSAHIGLVDRLFSRVGAADDLARGRSTFMVEMLETAAILNQAGPRSLVILDEIGRGTATFDGLSIAWATVEYLHDVNCARALFATHYHELTALGAKLAHLKNATMRVREWKGDVVFLHEVVPGGADRSYGIHVARLAGLPRAVIERAEMVLHALERDSTRGQPGAIIEDLPLFRPAPAEEVEAGQSIREQEVLAALRATDVDSLAPRQALELLYRLKALNGGEGG
jgi:DNA mismatch repair protein MutS